MILGDDHFLPSSTGPSPHSYHILSCFISGCCQMNISVRKQEVQPFMLAPDRKVLSPSPPSSPVLSVVMGRMLYWVEQENEAS